MNGETFFAPNAFDFYTGYLTHADNLFGLIGSTQIHFFEGNITLIVYRTLLSRKNYLEKSFSTSTIWSVLLVCDKTFVNIFQVYIFQVQQS